MAKRGRDDRDYPERSRPNAPRPGGSNHGHRAGNSRQDPKHSRNEMPPRKKQRLPSGPWPQQPMSDTMEHILRGSPILTASLLVQLLADLNKDPTAQDELRDSTDSRVLEDIERLRSSLQPYESKLKGLLHHEPKFPPSAPPMARFPSKLIEALGSSRMLAHWRTVPTLPTIKDPELAEIPFAHRSMFGNDHRKAVIAGYERLELLGDAYIEIMATRMLHVLYPELPAGRLSHLREKLVCNETLATFAMAYNFADGVRVPDTYLEQGVNRSKIWTKMLGDVFEAYVAALITADPENGSEIAEKWLQTLWAPLLPDAELLVEPDKMAKQDLQKKIGGVGVRLDYEQQGETVPFRGGQYWNMAVFLTGWGFEHEKLGEYKGRSKQVAELGAAEEAFINPLTGQIQAIKLRYDEKVRQERAKAAEAGEQKAGDQGVSADAVEKQSKLDSDVAGN